MVAGVEGREEGETDVEDCEEFVRGEVCCDVRRGEEVGEEAGEEEGEEEGEELRETGGEGLGRGRRRGGREW
jgi:hypothetical protein